MATDIYVLRKNIGIKPLGKKEVTSVRIFRDHSSMFTIEQKNWRGYILQRDAYQNHELDTQLQLWLNKGFTVS